MHLILEIRHGVPVAQTYVTMQVMAESFFQKNLLALGDATTLRTVTVELQKGVPWQTIEHPVTGPAALCKDVEIVKPLGSV
jgi:hypothetical protein